MPRDTLFDNLDEKTSNINVSGEANVVYFTSTLTHDDRNPPLKPPPPIQSVGEK
jgi:hypothetical protein